MFFNMFVREFVFFCLPVSSWEEIEGQKFSKVGLYICIFADFLFIFNVFDIAFISVILTVGLFYSGQPAHYKCYKGFMVSCLSIQPCHFNSSLNYNLVKKYFDWSRRSFLCVLKLISCSRTKSRHQFIVASSFYIENLSINIEIL